VYATGIFYLLGYKHTSFFNSSPGYILHAAAFIQTFNKNDLLAYASGTLTANTVKKAKTHNANTNTMALLAMT